MLKLFKQYEKLMTQLLMIMLALVIGLATLDIGWMIFHDLILAAPFLLIDSDQLLDVFGLFMLIIIGIELLETIMKTYFVKGNNHFEVVLSVAIIAIARKVIILDLKQVDSLTMFGIAAIILSLTIGYYFMKKSHDDPPKDDPKEIAPPPRSPKARKYSDYDN
ncbi:phosphate-starvation-inducible PsiE family protein [[Limnothrix rosea] IAM M-220]|uniref:phosphate-starvation-inducible PsiE family protein n=1 Tax=[Limnothrix rosea] IAM M-220 TaxID=454133 RepID=UPI0009659038|nr:phosphate-starvation-inducible PsiE family protein [[Limnothrix rosea] IAM M-220]OKH12722.1 phosphate-starvation-inducible E-like protein [[Limnothrix rosea] IAM M-220]